MKPWGSAINTLTVQNKAVVLDPVSNKAARREDERRCASKLFGYLKKCDIAVKRRDVGITKYYSIFKTHFLSS